MKSTEKLLHELGYNEHTILDWEHVNNVMKLYANQKLEQAGDIAYKAIENDESAAGVEYLIYELKDPIHPATPPTTK